MKTYLERMEKEGITIYEDPNVFEVWEKYGDGDVSLLPFEKIEKEEHILGKIAYLWIYLSKSSDEIIKIGYCHEGLLKGKVLLKCDLFFNIFNSIKEFTEYYFGVMARKDCEEFTVEGQYETRKYLSFEEYCEDVLVFDFLRDKSIKLSDIEKYDEENFKICKKLLRRWKYVKHIDDDPKVWSKDYIYETIFSLLPNKYIQILREYINDKEDKNVVSSFCSRIVESDDEFALSSMRKILDVYKQEMEDFHYDYGVNEEDPYHTIKKCVDYFEKKKG